MQALVVQPFSSAAAKKITPFGRLLPMVGNPPGPEPIQRCRLRLFGQILEANHFALQTFRYPSRCNTRSSATVFHIWHHAVGPNCLFDHIMFLDVDSHLVSPLDQ